MGPIKKLSKKERELDYLRGQLPLLSTLKELDSKQIQTILPYLSTDTHNGLCLCIHNSLSNYTKIPQDNIDQLKNVLGPKLNNYRYLSDKRNARSSKVVGDRAKVLVQSGEGLGIILSSVIPLLTSLLFPK